MPTPEFINKNIVLRIHARQIETFGGTPGIRDEGLLESALAQPQATFGGEFLHSTIHEQAAAYLYHLAMNHPFIDGNKRTGASQCVSKHLTTKVAATRTFVHLCGLYISLRGALRAAQAR